MIRTVFACLSLMLSPLALADPIPDFQATYRVEMNGLQVGELIQQLTTEADALRRFHTRTQARGMLAVFRSDVIEESSIWSLHDDAVRPHLYRYSRTGGRKDKRLTLNFDWQQNTVHIDDQEYPWLLELEPGTLDKMVYQLQIMLDLADGKQDLSYLIAEGGQLKTYDINLVGTETLNTPLGKIEAIKLVRERDADSGRSTTLWCAPSLGYLPIQLEHTEKDNSRFTAVIRELNGIPLEGFH